MPVTARRFVVGTALPDCRDYLADFTNAVQWDPGTVRCTRVDDGPVRAGSSWKNVTRFLGRDTTLDYRLEHLGDERVVLVGTNKTVTSIDDISLRSVTGGTEISYLSDVRFNGWARLTDPLLSLVFARLGTQTEKLLVAALGVPTKTPRAPGVS